MSARFDSEVMMHLDRLYRQHLIDEVAQLSRHAAARVSNSDEILFVPPGQNAASAFQQFHEDASIKPDEAGGNFSGEKILQPRKLSLRVF
jgi:hypothetical protein